MTAVQQFTTPAGASASCPMVGFSNDVGLLRSQILLLIGGRCAAATYQHERYTDNSNASLGGDFFNGQISAGSSEGIPLLSGYGACSTASGVPCTGCDSSSLPAIITTLLPGTGSCVDVINTSFAPGFSFTLSGISGFYNQFSKLDSEVSLVLTWGAFCTTEVFELVVIFDGSIPISWGVLVNSTGSPGLNVRSPTVQPFPNTFKSFQLVIHSITNNIYYQTSPQLLYTL